MRRLLWILLPVLLIIVVTSEGFGQGEEANHGNIEGQEKDTIERAIDWIAIVVELSGVAVIVATLLVASAVFLRGFFGASEFHEVYQRYRRNLGRGILLGLEFLVAGDIIGTVAVDPTFTNLGVLGIIVLIRTFLSWSLEIEIHGRWPWRGGPSGQLED